MHGYTGQQALSTTTCTGRELEDLKAHLLKYLSPCLAAEGVDQWLASGNRSNSLPSLGACLAVSRAQRGEHIDEDGELVPEGRAHR